MRAASFLLFTAIFWAVPSQASWDPTHALWQAWLKKYVVSEGDSSRVRYAAAKNTAEQELAPYLNALSAVTPKLYAGFSKAERMAFLINAYNAFTVKLVLDHYPVGSIRELGGLLSSPWKKRFFTLLGEKTHLDSIEHGRLRKQWNEPRIHFAVVCASVGCPALRPEAWRAAALEGQLQASARAFLSDRSRNRYDEKTNTLHLSKIFDWYAADFKKAAGSVQKFVAPYLTQDPVRQKLMHGAVIEYLDYDWSLNDAR